MNVTSARGELSPTATYHRRVWLWEPALPGAYADGRDGTLTILVTKGWRRIRTEIDHYAVQVEWEAAVDFGLKSFLLENELDPDEDGPFRCVVGGMAQACGCEAGFMDTRRINQTSCKHRDALAALIEERVI